MNGSPWRCGDFYLDLLIIVIILCFLYAAISDNAIVYIDRDAIIGLSLIPYGV